MISERDRLLAHYYDLEYAGYTEDVDFFVQFASTIDPERAYPLLDLGCGTGRIAFSLSEAGFRVTCLDVSEAMLEVCSAQARKRSVAHLITTVRADMANMTGVTAVPGGPFNMALCALNTFAYLHSSDEQLAMLGAVRALLVQHGLLLLDLTPPWPHLLPPSDGELYHHGTYPDHDGALIHKLVTSRAEPAAQTHHVTLIYDREEQDGTLKRTSKQLDLRWTGRYEMELLLKRSGYALENLYGSYELDEFGDDSERMIFVARA